MRGRDTLELCLLLLIVLASAVRLSSSAISPDSPGARQQTSQKREAKNAPARRDIVRTLESSLIQLFGFRHRPRPNLKDIIVPDAMMQLYKEQTGLEVDTMDLNLPGRHSRSANTARSFTHIESSVDATFPRNRFRLLFDLKGIPTNERLMAADIRLSRAPVATKGKRRRSLQQILVHDVVRPGRRGSREPILRLIDTKVVDVKDSEDVTMDVMPAVQRWLEYPKENYGLLVEVTKVDGSVASTEHIRLKRSADSSGDSDVETREQWAKSQPLLFTYTDDGKARRRTKRFPSRKHRRKDARETCRRHSLYVDFSEVGWDDWIVAPQGYDAFYCDGDCPFPLADHLNSTNHAIVQTLMNSVNPSTAPKACCIPTDLSPISMLYLNEENKVVLKNYQDMVVEGCGCR